MIKIGIWGEHQDWIGCFYPTKVSPGWENMAWEAEVNTRAEFRSRSKSSESGSDLLRNRLPRSSSAAVTYMSDACCGWQSQRKTSSSAGGLGVLPVCVASPPLRAPGQDAAACVSGHLVMATTDLGTGTATDATLTSHVFQRLSLFFLVPVCSAFLLRSPPHPPLHPSLLASLGCSFKVSFHTIISAASQRRRTCTHARARAGFLQTSFRLSRVVRA